MFTTSQSMKYIYMTILLTFLITTVAYSELHSSQYLEEIIQSSNQHNETPITLHEVLQSVAKTNPEIKEAISHYKSIISEKRLAKSGFHPTIGAELTAGPEYTNGVPTNDEDESLMTASATLYARQNLYKGGQTTAYIDETEARINSAAYEVLTTANQIFLQTAEAYINVLKAREEVNIAKGNVATQTRILKQIKEKTDSGFGRISDLTNSESRLALAKGNFISKQQDLNQAVTKFHRQFGRLIKPESFVSPKPKYQLPSTVEEAVQVAFTNHPALEVAKFNILVRKYSQRKAESSKYPTLDLELKAQHRENTGGNEGGTDQASAMLKLNYTFYDGGARKAEISKMRQYMLKEYQKSYIERRNVNESIRLAWNILAAEDHKRTYLNDHVKLSLKTLSEFTEEYHLGRRTLLEILDMEKEHYAATSSYIQSKYAFLIAYYQASQSIGAILHEFDTGIMESVNLAHIKKDFNLKPYDQLDTDIDKDQLVDLSDQCDNSVNGVTTGKVGCSETNYRRLGYKSPKEITPYIITPAPALAAIPAPVVLEIDTTTKKEQTFNLNNINFATMSSDLTPKSKEIIASIATQLKTIDKFSLQIIGHTDSRGKKRYNQKLSQNRAESVAKALIKSGINKEAIQTKGLGEMKPIKTNKTAEGRRLNRRTEFKLTIE